MVMKVTAIIPDEIVRDIQKFTGGKNITDSLIRALSDWLYTKRLDELEQDLVREPLNFREGYSAEQIRRMNKRI